MKIAIVTPHPIPFAVGGAESLWWGLQNYINTTTPHSCDILALVSPENTLDSLVASYKAFSELDLSGYDCVISGKYPAWMVRHPNHVCYMLHRLRGLYDTYSGPGVEAVASSRVRALIAWMRDLAGEQGAHEFVLAEFFERYRALRASELPEIDFVFPGPLAREIVQFLDGVGLSKARIRRFASNSETVAKRLGYFPSGAGVTPLHHPPHRDDYRCGEQDYFFTSSRLDGPKRVELIIAAMRHVKAAVPLLIAGSGPDEARLKALALDDPRIRFLGFVPDDEMPGLYADALAVPFVPRDEDYGLITVEAMRSAKPVVTVRDAGGPTELIRDGENGFICAAEAGAIGAKLEWLTQNRDEARKMGEAARASVAHITWGRVFDTLMERPVAAPQVVKKRRPKLTVATTFPIDPPTGGGQARVFHLYRHMAERYDIDIISLHDEAAKPREIAPGVVETRVAKSARHLSREQQIAHLVGEQPVGDIAAGLAVGLTPEYSEVLANSCATSVAGVACHPYLVDQLRGILGKKPLWYEAQDVERDLKSVMLSNHLAGESLLREVARMEQTAWRFSSHVFACAQGDLDRLTELYGPTRAWLHEVPNGVALESLRFSAPEARRVVQDRTGFGKQPTGLFMGSWHQPNIEAVEEILNVAKVLPDVRFLIVGSVCRPFEGRQVPDNVYLLGLVETVVRDDLLASAHFALNPMQSGSGTNLKMLDYFAAGIPVISSPVGARGLAVEAGKHFISTEKSRFCDAIRGFLAMPKAQIDDMVARSREIVEAHYSWEAIAHSFMRELDAR